MRQAVYIAGLMAVLVFAATPVFAGGAVVPEIDGGSLATGLGLLSGGLLILRARWGATSRQRRKED
jgi:hypothetical protein